MKKLNYFVIALFATFAISCSNDNDPPPASDAPTVSSPSIATSVEVGKVVTITFAVDAPGTVASISVTATGGEAVTISPDPIIGKTTGNVDVTYTAGLVDGDFEVTLTVTDAQATPKSSGGTESLTITLGPTSTSELLVAKFTSAPTLDGEIDDMWNLAQQLISTAEVPALSARNTYLNSDGAGVEEGLGLFFPYSEAALKDENFTLRSGYFGSDIYFLLEWDDDVDSKDRQSWYFHAGDKLWKQEHKYANAANDQFYEDKFAFIFPIGTVDGFSSLTCGTSCHGTGGTITTPKDKHTRHYLTTVDQKIDMWHWKRVRGTHNDRIDDQRIEYVAGPYDSGSNGRGGDPDSGGGSRSGYSDNIIKDMVITGTSTVVSVPKYVIPGETNYYWIPENELPGATPGNAKLVTAVDAEGVLTYDGGTIDPTGDTGYDQGTGDKRFPSILTRDFIGERADLTIKVTHTGTGWITEFTRKLNTGDPYDVVFVTTEELPFGLAIFDNAAIAHAIKPGLLMKFEQ